MFPIVIEALRDPKEEVEIRWFAGWFRSHQGRKANMFLRGRQSKATHLRSIPFEFLPALPIGAIVGTDGSILESRAEGRTFDLTVHDLSAGVDIPFDGNVPRSLYPLDGHKGWDQRILRYEFGHTVCLIPSVEIIRYFFCLNVRMTRAIMEPGGLLALAACPNPGRYEEAEILFTEEMPKRVISNQFVQEFAWIAIDREARRAWDSVLELSAGTKYLTLRPPKIAGRMLVRGQKFGNTIFVQEIVSFKGRRHPCELLEFSHPSFGGMASRSASGKTPSDASVEMVAPIREAFDLSGDAAARRNMAQRAIAVSRQFSSFSNDVRVRNRSGLRGAPTDEEMENPNQDAAGGPAKEGDRASGNRQRADHRLAPQPRRSKVGLNADGESGELQPLELNVLTTASVDYAGETRNLAEVIHLIALHHPRIKVSMSFCFLRGGRRISSTDRGRRVCLIATFEEDNRFPVVIMDVDHTSLTGLAGLLLRYKRQSTMAEIELHMEVLLDALVARGGRWDPTVEQGLRGVLICERLPRIVRRQGVRSSAMFLRSWTYKLYCRIQGIDEHSGFPKHGHDGEIEGNGTR